MFGLRCVFVVLISIVLSLLLPSCNGASIKRSYDYDLDSDIQTEIITYAAKIIKLVMHGRGDGTYVKRNGGTADALLSLPHLFLAGRR